VSSRVLCVDDDLDLLEAIQRQFFQRFQIDIAQGGVAGLEAVRTKGPYAVIISDLKMPGMDGIAFLARARKIAPDSVRIMLTGHADLDVAMEAVNEGSIFRFVTKPCPYDTMALIIEQGMDQHRLVTAEKQLNEELKAYAKELEAFSHTVSHDLREPLWQVDNFVRMLNEECSESLTDEGKHYLDRISSATNHMEQLITDLLALSQAAGSTMRRQEVNLSSLALEIAEGLSSSQPDHPVELVVADGVVAIGDADLLWVALENMLGNAWKFTRNIEGARVEFGLAGSPGQPEYFVRDNGAGFDQSEADKLFTPFQRLHELSEFEGTGIGLATVRRIIHRHGGRVRAEGEVGKGATFYFTLA